MARVPRKLLAISTAAFAMLGADPSLASGLQVAPVGISLTADESSDGLTLSNVGEFRLHAQVRVYAWRQGEDGEILEPSDELVVSPPMLALEPGAQQLVRVIRKGPPPLPGAPEQAYRIVIDELPVGDRPERGLDFVLRYSLPAFLQPADDGARPELHWDLAEQDGMIAVIVTNSGGKHAQIADVVLRGADGSRTVLATGLLGYALPGASRTWATPAPWSASAPEGTLEVRINGQVAHESLPVAAASR